MLVIVVEKAPPQLRGRLSRLLKEIKTGVYVGVYNRRVRERIWKETKKLIGKGNAVIVWSDSTESGYSCEYTNYLSDPEAS